jgi:UDP-N-acetylglucosamine acyltransferase
MAIHPTAVVHANARVHETAEIGPYCVIGAEVEIGARTLMLAHVYVEGPITIGEENVFQPYSSIGSSPQDLKYQGERTETRIGNRNLVREFVTVHRGTEGGGGLTSIADDNLLQAYSHVAHDCHIASNCILAHGATLGGHVTVEDWAVVGAHSGVHQFCIIGKHCYIGGYSVITQSVMPFSLVVTERGARTFGVNKTGLERRGFSKETIQNLHKSFRTLTQGGLNTEQALERISTEIEGDESVDELVAFIKAADRGIVK